MNDALLMRILDGRCDRSEKARDCSWSGEFPFARGILDVIGKGSAIDKIHDQRGSAMPACGRLCEREIVVLYNIGMIKDRNRQRILLKACHEGRVQLRLGVKKFDSNIAARSG